MDMTPQTWPEWYDGRHINEVQFFQQFFRIRARLIHLVDKEKDRDLIPREQPPQGFYMTLHAVRTADQKKSTSVETAPMSAFTSMIFRALFSRTRNCQLS